MICTLTLNPALDLTYTVAALHPGRSHRVPPPAIRAGGKGVNVARVLTEQGIEAQVLAPVGGPGAEQFVEDLRQASIPHRLTASAAPLRRTIAVVSPDGTTNLNEAGTGLTAEEQHDLLATLAHALAGAQVLVCSGSTPEGTPDDLLPQVFQTARAAGARVLVDTSGPALLAGADAGADLLKPNREELLAAAGLDPSADATQTLQAARALQQRSGGWVVLSLGPDGLVALGPQPGLYTARLPAALSGNPTGAGDAAVAALAVGLSHGRYPDDPAVLRHAAAWSAAAVLAPLAGSIADPGELLNQIVLRNEPEPS